MLKLRSALLLACVAVAGSAPAAVITQFVSATACSPCTGGASSGVAYLYSVSLDTQQLINTGLNAAFGTLYDFGPISGSITTSGLLSSNFLFTTNTTNTPASGTHVPVSSAKVS